MIGFEGEQDFKGRGVAYCATCDGEFFTGRDIFVIGSGFAACEEALFLTRFARKIRMMMITDDFTCTGGVVEEVKAHPMIEISYETGLEKVWGDGFVQGVSFRKGEETFSFEAEEGFGVFVFAGYVPASGNFKGEIEVDPQGYIITDSTQQTNLEGVYAAGDICIKPLRQVVTAVSDGALAATALEKYMAAQYEAYDIPRRLYTSPKRKAAPEAAAASAEDDGSFLTADMRAQLEGVFARFETDVLLRYAVDDRAISRELQSFMGEMKGISKRVKCEAVEAAEGQKLPAISLHREDGEARGVSFHGVPGGHEFNSFVIGLYNAAGPGQAIDPEDLARIRAITKPVKMEVAVTLSCNNCPELVAVAERVALENPNVTLDIYDLAHFEWLKDEYKVMSVPCMILDGKDVSFGKKTMKELLDIVEAHTAG